MLNNNVCPNCDSAGMFIFYELKNVPVHSVLLMPTQEMALNYPKGDIVLGFCLNCGFISNVAFEPGMHEYSSRYEETQGFSTTFNAFHQKLATRLIERHDLHGKNLIEIGCGKGEFLTLLCELGGNHGVGFDPAYVSERNRSQAKNRITFIKDFYSKKYASYPADFVCCKMTLEHIQQTAEFVNTVRDSLGKKSETIVFFQMPNVTRILRELAFWDIYYEHCSYFSLESLAYLFRKCRFDILELWKDYDDQYLMIEARPSNPPQSQQNDLEPLADSVAYFYKNYKHKLNTWKSELQQMKQSGQRVVIWGAGSKGVAFLTTLNIQDDIEYAIDINPYKHGMYMAGTGQKIVGPSFLKEYQPDVVIVMNPVYVKEIRQDLDKMKLNPRLMTV